MNSTAASDADGRRHIPMQRRASAKVEAILVAARTIMADPNDELTVRKIEDRVDFSVGTIYRYFDSLDAIVNGVLRRHADAFEDELHGVLASVELESLDQLFSKLAETAITFYRDHPQYTQIQLAGEYLARYAEIEDESNARLVEAVADLAISAGLMPTGVRSRTRLLVHWSAIGAAFRIAFGDNPRGDRTVLAEARAMAAAFAQTYE